jgi:hypothetical protein
MGGRNGGTAERWIIPCTPPCQRPKACINRLSRLPQFTVCAAGKTLVRIHCVVTKLKPPTPKGGESLAKSAKFRGAQSWTRYAASIARGTGFSD